MFEVLLLGQEVGIGLNGGDDGVKGVVGWGFQQKQIKLIASFRTLFSVPLQAKFDWLMYKLTCL